jgi:ribosomal protein S18 acetylase RimI-like enzyme
VAAWRTAGPGDEGAVADLMHGFYEESGATWERGAARRALAHLLHAPELGRVLLADGGYLVLTFGYSLEFGGRDAFIDEFYVRPETRGRGLGRAGIEHAATTCRAAGVQAIHLEVEDSNPDAARLYERMGFTFHSRRLMTWRLDT